MSKQLIIVEKPFYFTNLFRCNLIQENSIIVSTFSMGLLSYKLPKLTFQHIPFTDLPSKLAPTDYGSRWLLKDFSGNALISVEEGMTRKEIITTYRALVRNLRESEIDEIVVLADQDRRGYGESKRLIDQIGHDLSKVKIVSWKTLEPTSLRNAWNSRSSWKSNQQAVDLANQHMAKKTFDYWWFANSSLVFSELCRQCNLLSKFIVSKYEIMALVLLSRGEPMNEFDLYQLMTDWTGTGKFDKGNYENRAAIGSVASRITILENAISRGAISKDIDGKLLLSSEGHKFINGLHPKTFDPDLPFRLRHWVENQNFTAMEQYIRTVFGRQLRYQRKYY